MLRIYWWHGERTEAEVIPYGPETDDPDEIIAALEALADQFDWPNPKRREDFLNRHRWEETLWICHDPYDQELADTRTPLTACSFESLREQYSESHDNI